MYHGLTTNLPREIMGYSDYAFSAANMQGSSVDGRHFPCSEEVRRGAAKAEFAFGGVGDDAGLSGGMWLLDKHMRRCKARWCEE